MHKFPSFSTSLSGDVSLILLLPVTLNYKWQLSAPALGVQGGADKRRHDHQPGEQACQGRQRCCHMAGLGEHVRPNGPRGYPWGSWNGQAQQPGLGTELLAGPRPLGNVCSHATR